MRLLKNTLWITVVVLVLLFFKLILTVDLNSYGWRRASTEGAKAIAQAVIKYKNATGSLPHLEEHGWANELKPFLDPTRIKQITASGQMVDAKGNLYEFTRRDNCIDIYSYGVFEPVRINLVDGTIGVGRATNGQCLRAFFHDIFNFKNLVKSPFDG